MTDPQTTDPMIAALLRERAGYLQSHRPERAAQVTAELKRRGYEDPAEVEPQANEDATGAPRGRRAPGKRSTTGAAE
jgi:hypothetical protein